MYGWLVLVSLLKMMMMLMIISNVLKEPNNIIERKKGPKNKPDGTYYFEWSMKVTGISIFEIFWFWKNIRDLIV